MAYGISLDGYPDLATVSDYIRQSAIARGINPDTALRVARGEGLQRGTWQSNVMKDGVREPSYGPFQLLKGGPGTGFRTGLGNEFQSSTGLDPANPANWKQGIDYALDTAAKSGWGQWYGAKAQGITGKMGIGSNAAPLGVTLSSAPAPVPSFPNPAVVQPGLSSPNIARPAAPMVGPQPGLSSPPISATPVAPKPLIPGTGLSGIGNIASALGGLANLFKPKEPATPPPDYTALNVQAGQQVQQGIAARQQGAAQILQGLLAKKKQEALLPAMYL